MEALIDRGQKAQQNGVALQVCRCCIENSIKNLIFNVMIYFGPVLSPGFGNGS
jgi:hypothetical protein